MTMTLHLDQPAFRTLLDNISQREDIRMDILEKDYYVTLMLNELSNKQDDLKAYFKGGTALYKALSSINRFSEDIDLTVCVDDCASGNQAKKRLEQSAKGYTCLNIIEGDPGNENRKGSITSIYGYDTLLEPMVDPLQRFGRVKVEATSFTVSEPVAPIEISPVIYTMATDQEKKLLHDMFGVFPFIVQTITLERIFMDKVFATEYYYQRFKHYDVAAELMPNNFAIDVAKHIYDLMILHNNPKIRLLLEDQAEQDRLIGILRKEGEVRAGGLAQDFPICDFTYLNNLLLDEEFAEHYDKMQEIYIFKDEDKLPLHDAQGIISAIRLLAG